MDARRRPARSIAALGMSGALVLGGCGGSDATDSVSDTTADTSSAIASSTQVDQTVAAPDGTETTGAGEVPDAPAATDAGATPATSAASAGGNTITIADFAFGGVTEVAVGTTIVVTNTDSAPHTFTSDDGVFDAGSLRQGDTFEFTFDTVGEFAYHCNFHPSMTGSITVTG